MTLSLDKVIKGVVGAIVIVILLIVVMRWWGDYRLAAVEASLPETTTTPAPSATPPGEGTQSTPNKPDSSTVADTKAAENAAGETGSKQTIVVLIEGLNFREKADRGSKAIRALSKGEKVELLKTIDSWYQVKDENGETGWISSNPAYAKVEK